MAHEHRILFFSQINPKITRMSISLKTLIPLGLTLPRPWRRRRKRVIQQSPFLRQLVLIPLQFGTMFFVLFLFFFVKFMVHSSWRTPSSWRLLTFLKLGTCNMLDDLIDLDWEQSALNVSILFCWWDCSFSTAGRLEVWIMF